MHKTIISAVLFLGVSAICEAQPTITSNATTCVGIRACVQCEYDGGGSFGEEGRAVCLERELQKTKGIKMSDQHKYSIDEIDEMRRWVYAIENAPFALMPAGYIYRAPSDAEMNRRVEDKLRTYMLNGTTPEELKEKFMATGAPEMHPHR